MQVKNAASETSAKPQSLFTDDTLTIPPRTMKTITDFDSQPSEWNTTGTVISLEKITETAFLLISHSMSTIFDKTVAVRVTNAADSPNSIENKTQIAQLAVVTPEQSMFIKAVDVAIPSTIPEGDPRLPIFWNELFRTKKPKTKSKK